MHKDLQALLEKVWTDRRRLAPMLSPVRRLDDPAQDDAVWAIYQIYSGEAAAARVPVATAQCLAFLQELAGAEDHVGQGPGIQAGNRIHWQQPGFTAALYRDAHAAAAVALHDAAQAQALELAREVARSFIHYRGNAGGAAVERIYVNTRRAARSTVFAWLLTHMLGPRPLAGTASMKVSGPDDGGRVDSILLYLTTERAALGALDLLRCYQNEMGFVGHFEATVPKLTTPVAGLVGVARAQEPPQTYVHLDGHRIGAQPTRGMSFGLYRATLIAEALRASQGHGSSTFECHVTLLFEAAGIDVNTPSLQRPLRGCDQRRRSEPQPWHAVEPVAAAKAPCRNTGHA